MLCGDVTIESLPAVRIRSTELTQILQNLIANAIKFVPPGVAPQVTIAAERADEGSWRFTVTDNGLGIAPTQRDRVFHLFTRLNTGGRYPGTGLGLAIAKKVVERYGGEIGIDDAPSGSGTRIWFTLPG